MKYGRLELSLWLLYDGKGFNIKGLQNASFLMSHFINELKKKGSLF